MGLRHFQQMLQEATTVDRLAVITAIQLAGGRDSVVGSGLWDTSTFDELMAAGRQLDTIYADYLTSMRELVARRRLHPRLFNPMTGQMQQVQEPDVFGHDEAAISAEQFHQIMMTN